MNKKELIKLLDKYEIEYEITDNTKEVEEGLRLLDEALEKIGIAIPKEARVDTVTTERASNSDLVSRQGVIRAICQECVHGGYDECSVDCVVAEILRKLLPVGDCISRADTIKAICAKCTQEGYDECREDCTEVKVVKGMPSCNHTCNQKQVTSKLETAENATSEGEESTMNQPKSKLESDLISRQAAIEALMAHFMSQTYTGEQVEQAEKLAQKIMNALPPVEPKEQNEEDILKFYYVESLDEYWIGQRCGTRYYGKWTGNCFTFGYSRYLPWGEHVVAPDTLWKEHTYPSEPKEIPFNEWLQGFLEKECQPERTGGWIVYSLIDEGSVELECPECGDTFVRAVDYRPNFCENCGADMRGAE